MDETSLMAPPTFSVLEAEDGWHAVIEWPDGERVVSPVGSEEQARAEAEAARVQYQRFLADCADEGTES